MPYEINTQIDTMDYKSLGGFLKEKMTEMEKMGEGNSDGIKSLSTEQLVEFKSRNDELTKGRERYAALREADETFQKQKADHMKAFKTADRLNIPFPGEGNGGNGGQAQLQGQEYKSLGEMFAESERYQAIKARGAGNWDPKSDGNLTTEIDGVSIKSIETGSYMKTTMTTSGGWVPYPTMGPRPPVMSAQYMPVVADLIPQDDTDQPTILWYEETTWTNNAGFVTEGSAKPEAALGLTLRSQPVCKIAVTLPITEEQIMDVPQVRAYIDGRLTLMVKRAEEVDLLGGSGVSPHLMGFHSKPGIGSIAKAAGEDNPDAILRAITDVNSIQGFANVTGIIMNPLQWLNIRLLRTTTGDYIWGHPALVGPATLWGLPVIATNAETAARALVGDFQMYSHISRRMGIRIDVGYINADFINNIQRIRLEERLSLEIYRPAAFEEITSLS